MPSPFERDDQIAIDVAAPCAALLALLDDLHEQAEIFEANIGDDEFAAEILASLKGKIIALALLVTTKR